MDYDRGKKMFMREALKEAVPPSPMMKYRLAVSWSGWSIIGRGRNAREELQRAVMHAKS